ncbi:MAG TPA: DNA gyrase inhibitor YacG [Steroidobacteraceae bacterium]|nr:DNA gyrase inhibitor YacG [Steroidobacteraceae bacterium]
MGEVRFPTVPTFACPTCQRPVEWSPEARWRPFCSERCRLIDLGAWMTEQRAIPSDDAPEDAGEAGTPDLQSDDPRRH